MLKWIFDLYVYGGCNDVYKRMAYGNNFIVLPAPWNVPKQTQAATTKNVRRLCQETHYFPKRRLLPPVRTLT